MNRADAPPLGGASRKAMPLLNAASSESVIAETDAKSSSSKYGTLHLQRKTGALWRCRLLTIATAIASIALILIGAWEARIRHDDSANHKHDGENPSDGPVRVNVTNITVPIDGLMCDQADSALVYYPIDIGVRKYPLIIFSPGDFQFIKGWNVKTRYAAILEEIAQNSFVVVSPLATGGWCQQAALDQQRVLAFIRERASGSESWLWNGISFANGAGVMGISMGGLATIVNAIGNADVGAAMAISPFWDGYHLMEDGLPRYPIQHVDTPLLFVTGSDDNESPMWFIEALYNTIESGVPSAIAILQNYSHHTIRLSPGLVLLASVWFRCTLYNDLAACAIVSDPNQGMLVTDQAEIELQSAHFESRLEGLATKAGQPQLQSRSGSQSTANSAGHRHSTLTRPQG